MARQKGFFKVTGTLGDINFYVVKGVGYARKAGGGFNGKTIKTKASMQRVRENASEFGHCSTVKKAFRLALVPLFNPPSSSMLHRRLMGLFTQLKDLDKVSERGQRRVANGVNTDKGKRLLEAFVFVPECRATTIVLAQSSFNWGTQTLSLAPLNLNLVTFPKGATHLALTLGVLDFNFNTLDPTLNCSPTLFLEKGRLTEAIALQPEIIETPNATGLAVLGLQFVEVINTEVYALKTLGAYGCKLIACLTNT